MKKLYLIAAILLTITMGCTKEELCTESTTVHECDNNDTTRVGCMCNDGTQSTATGSGACSGHGGVNYWQCYDCK
jgi:hypothetical protein